MKKNFNQFEELTPIVADPAQQPQEITQSETLKNPESSPSTPSETPPEPTLDSAVATAMPDDTPETSEAAPAMPEPDPDPVPQSTAPVITQADVDRLVAEAEARGYLRGCNEQIERLMAAPRMYEQPARTTAPADSEVMILNNLRRSVWE